MKIPYWPLLIGPSLLFAFGFALNAFVMGINHGSMPVLWPGGCTPDVMIGDTIHSCMTPFTHLKFLCDWIVVRGVGIASPGDFLELAYELIVIPSLVVWATLMIRDHKRAEEETNPWGPRRQ